jgi:Fibronectin type III domain
MGPLSIINNTITEITLAWSALTDISTGNSEILAYSLYWDENSGLANIRLIKDLVTLFEVRGTTGGLNYKFRVTATNIYGEGEPSDELN